MKVSLNLKEIKDLSFTTKWYEVSVKGKIRDDIKQTNCDLDQLYLNKCKPHKIINITSERISNPEFKVKEFAELHNKTTLIMEFMPMDEDCDRYTAMSNEKITILIHKGKVYALPCSMQELDTKELFK